MPKTSQTIGAVAVIAIGVGALAYGMEHWYAKRGADRAAGAQAVAVNAVRVPKISWAASAPGRVEPRGGEVRVGTQVPGKVVQVLARANDSVKAGDLLVRLSDDDLQPRLVAATTEISVRRRERDGETVIKLAVDRRAAEDAVSFAERAQFRARMDLDQLQITASGDSGKATAEAVAAARTALTEANDKVEAERANLRRVQALAGMPLPTRLDASLATARAELSAIEIAIERTRIRAPSDGTVLQVNARVGEIVAPSPEDALLTFGDLSGLKVRAEVEERDIAKVRVGQQVVVRTDTFGEQEFTGTVERMSQALGTQRLPNKGPRRPNDFEVLQVVINLDGKPPLLPGMRVDVFFKPDAGVAKSAIGTDVKPN